MTHPEKYQRAIARAAAAIPAETLAEHWARVSWEANPLFRDWFTRSAERVTLIDSTVVNEVQS